MTELHNYWIPVEQQWRDNHLDALRPCLELTRRSHDWVARIATHADIVNGDRSNKRIVSRMLLRRLGEELRAVELLAENGHGFQAATAACNLFEQSHFLTYVGMDDANARTFMEWTDPHRSPINIRQLVDYSGKARSWPQPRCDEEYAKYRFLCGFKHNNPVFQCVLQLPVDPDRYMSQFALAESVWCVLSAVSLFTVLNLHPHNADTYINECNELMNLIPPLFQNITTTETAGTQPD